MTPPLWQCPDKHREVRLHSEIYYCLFPSKLFVKSPHRHPPQLSPGPNGDPKEYCSTLFGWMATLDQFRNVQLWPCYMAIGQDQILKVQAFLQSRQSCTYFPEGSSNTLKLSPSGFWSRPLPDECTPLRSPVCR